MLASFRAFIGGKDDRGKDKGNDKGKDKKKEKDGKKSKVYVPPKFHGGLTGTDHVLVEGKDVTFEVPFGVIVDPIFQYIRTDQYTSIQPILKEGYKLNKKLFEGVYLAAPVALYYGDSRAAKNLRDYMITQIEDGDVKKLTETSLKDILSTSKEVIDTIIENNYGEKFDDDHLDKANAVMEILVTKLDDFKKRFCNKLSIKIRGAPAVAAPARRGRRGQAGSGGLENDKFYDYSEYKLSSDDTEDKPSDVMLGGRYSGEKYTVFYPLSAEDKKEPIWYEIKPKSMNNLTPLQYAVGYGSVDSVRVLIRNGADFTVSTLSGISLQNLANSRKDNDYRTRDVQFLLQYIFEASSAATRDHDLQKMKDDYVVEGNVRDEAKKYSDVLNFVYTKTYKALKKGKSTSEVLGEVGEKAKKQGRQDGLDKKPEDRIRSSEENPLKEDRDGYILGYKIGEAERAGTEDGLAKSPPDANFDKNTLDTEIRNAYKDAYNKAKGKDVYRGFKDGITGKEKNSGESVFLKFDTDLASTLKFKTSDSTVVNEYEIGHGYGIQKFYKEIKNIVGRAENDGRLDGYNGKEKYSTKYFIKSKPLFGAIIDSTAPGGYRDTTEGNEPETFEVEYNKLDLSHKYDPIDGVEINKDKIKEVPTSVDGIAYGSYIKALYDYGFVTGRNDKKTGGKTYRKKRTTKSKTYKKKLSKK